MREENKSAEDIIQDKIKNMRDSLCSVELTKDMAKSEWWQGYKAAMDRVFEQLHYIRS